MNITTPPIDPAHPLAKLIERSIKAHKLPSCEGCKHSDIEASHDADGIERSSFHMCDMSDELVVASHFCAAWEPRS